MLAPSPAVPHTEAGRRGDPQSHWGPPKQSLPAWAWLHPAPRSVLPSPPMTQRFPGTNLQVKEAFGAPAVSRGGKGKARAEPGGRLGCTGVQAGFPHGSPALPHLSQFPGHGTECGRAPGGDPQEARAAAGGAGGSSEGLGRCGRASAWPLCARQSLGSASAGFGHSSRAISTNSSFLAKDSFVEKGPAKQQLGLCARAS